MTRTTTHILTKTGVMFICIALLFGAIFYRSLSVHAAVNLIQKTRAPLNLSDQKSSGDAMGVDFAMYAYIAWTGTDSKHSLNITQDNGCTPPLTDSCFDFASTFNQQSIQGQGPTLAKFTSKVGRGETIYIAWVGTNHQLNVEQCIGGCSNASSGYGYHSIITETSNYRPSIAGFNNKLYIAWTGTDGHINVESSSDGFFFGDKKITSERSITAPDIISFGNALWVTWVGEDPNHSLNVAKFDGNNLINKTLPGQTGVVDNPGSSIGPGDNFYIGWTTGARPGASSLYYLKGVPSIPIWSNRYYITGALPLYGAGFIYYLTTSYIIWTETNGSSLHIRTAV